MEEQNKIDLIDTIFQQNKPESVDTLELKIEPSSGRYQYYVNPQYVIDKNDGFDLMKINGYDYLTSKGIKRGNKLYDGVNQILRDVEGYLIYCKHKRGLGV